MGGPSLKLPPLLRGQWDGRVSSHTIISMGHLLLNGWWAVPHEPACHWDNGRARLQRYKRKAIHIQYLEKGKTKFGEEDLQVNSVTITIMHRLNIAEMQINVSSTLICSKSAIESNVASFCRTL